MINRIILFIIFQSFLFVLTAVAQEEKVNEPDEDTVSQIFEEFLVNPTNPFLSLLPEEKVVVKAPEAPKPKETPSKPEPKQIPDSVIEMSNKLKLNGLVWRTDQPQAIINGQLLSEGETYQGTKIVKITEKGVQIKYNGYSIFVKNKIE